MIEEIEDTVVFSVARPLTFSMNNKFKPTAKPTKAKIKEYFRSSTFVSPWGDDNLWPITVMDAYRACAPAQICVEILTALAYGNGIGIYKRTADGAVRVIRPEAEAWFRQSRTSAYLQRAFTDYFVLGNQFAQPIRNVEGNGWGKLANISAPFCRLSALNKEKTYSETVFVHGNWEYLPTEEECAEIVLLQDDFVEEIIKANPDEKAYMWRTGNYTPGNVFYDEAAWHALIKNGTIDVFPEIPKIRKQRVKNAMVLKYHVQINEAYWWLKMGGGDKGKKKWEEMSKADRQKTRTAFYTSIDNNLQGSDNAFKSLYSPTFTDPRTGTVVELIKITKIETEVGEKAAFDPDKMTSVADVFLAFGLPSAIANTVLSDNKSRGGGSDIREGNSSVVARMPIIRDMILAPLDFCLRNTVNKVQLLQDDEFLGFSNDLLTTLDNNSKGVQTNEPK